MMALLFFLIIDQRADMAESPPIDAHEPRIHCTPNAFRGIP